MGRLKVVIHLVHLMGSTTEGSWGWRGAGGRGVPFNSLSQLNFSPAERLFFSFSLPPHLLCYSRSRKGSVGAQPVTCQH